jgi:hypothetical protein
MTAGVRANDVLDRVLCRFVAGNRLNTNQPSGDNDIESHEQRHR